MDFRAAASRRPPARGTRTPIAAATSAKGRMLTKTNRHDTASTIQPPTRGPSAVDTRQHEREEVRRERAGRASDRKTAETDGEHTLPRKAIAQRAAKQHQSAQR